jgi:hypothetical protein
MPISQQNRFEMHRSASRWMQIGSIVCVVVCGQSCSNSDPPQNAVMSVVTEPQLTPDFSPNIHDYVVHCADSASTHITAQVAGGASVTVNGSAIANAAPAGASSQLEQSISLNPGQRFSFSTEIDGISQEYSVRCLPADFPPLSATSQGPAGAEWYVVTPTLGAPAGTAAPAYVIITDVWGTPVWWFKETIGVPINAQNFGSNVIGWGFASTGGMGTYVMRAFNGTILNVLSAGLDEHDLKETPTGTYLGLRYVPRVCPPDCADMSAWGGSSAMSVIDAEIIEIDANSNVLWLWRTRDHIGLYESGESGSFQTNGADIIHANAIEPDGTDGVLFSGRNLNAIYHITKSSGNVDWKLGGATTPQSLTVRGDTRLTGGDLGGVVLKGQHDVQLLADGTVTVHDNGTDAGRGPSALRFAIDTTLQSATVLEIVEDSRATDSICCGSARRLPNGTWVIQWGGLPYFTEISTGLNGGGLPQFTVNYNLSGVFSYRADPILPGIVSADSLRQGMDAMAATQ